MRVQEQIINDGSFTPRQPPVPRQQQPRVHMNDSAQPSSQQVQPPPPTASPPSSAAPAAATQPSPFRQQRCHRTNTQCGWGRSNVGGIGGTPCGMKQLAFGIFLFFCSVIFLKVAKCAAWILAFFLSWVVLPAGGMVLGLGTIILWKTLSTAFYGLLFAFAVWRFTWLLSISYQFGTWIRKHWLKRYEYVAAGKIWCTLKKMEWDSKRRVRLQQRQQSRSASQRAQSQESQSTTTAPLSPSPEQQQRPQMTDTRSQASTFTGHRQSSFVRASASEPSAPSAPATPAPTPMAGGIGSANTINQAPPEFLNFLDAMNSQIAEYDRAYRLPAGSGLQLLLQQQQQSQGSRKLYPNLDDGDQQQQSQGSTRLYPNLEDGDQLH